MKFCVESAAPEHSQLSAETDAICAVDMPTPVWYASGIHNRQLCGHMCRTTFSDCATETIELPTGTSDLLNTYCTHFELVHRFVSSSSCTTVNVQLVRADVEWESLSRGRIRGWVAVGSVHHTPEDDLNLEEELTRILEEANSDADGTSSDVPDIDDDAPIDHARPTLASQAAATAADALLRAGYHSENELLNDAEVTVVDRGLPGVMVTVCPFDLCSTNLSSFFSIQRKLHMLSSRRNELSCGGFISQYQRNVI